MAVSISDIVSASVQATTVVTVTTSPFTITSNSNRAGILGLSVGNTGISAITGSIGGVSGTAIAGTDSTTTQTNRALQFGVTAPPSGSQTATMSWTGSSNAQLGVVTTSGVDQSASFNNGTFNSASAAGPTSVAITSTNGDLTVDTIISNDGAVTPSAPTQTSQWALSFGFSQAAAGSSGPGTGTTTHQWTVGGATSQWVASGANFNQLAAVPDSIGSANLTSSAGRFIGWTT